MRFYTLVSGTLFAGFAAASLLWIIIGAWSAAEAWIGLFTAAAFGFWAFRTIYGGQKPRPLHWVFYIGRLTRYN